MNTEKKARIIIQLLGLPFLIWLVIIDYRLAIIIFALLWVNNTGYKRWNE